jgi:hypothetical protein
VIGAVMNGYQEMVKNLFVVLNAKVRIGINLKNKVSGWQLMVNPEK